MEAVLLKYTPDPDHLVALAARRCYSSLSASEISKRLTEDEVERLLCLLRKRNHLSPYEHVDFTFSVGGISRALSHQLVRHRIASYSQESQRYVEYSKLDRLPFVCPPKIENNPEAKSVFDSAVDGTLAAYRKLMKIGIPAEDARYIFPNAIETKMVFTFNARSLFNFFEQRCCLKAQWEIRKLAYLMLGAVREVAPKVFRTAGPPCRYGESSPGGAPDESFGEPYCRESDTKCPSHPSKRDKRGGEK